MPADILLISIARDGNFVHDLFKKGASPLIKLTCAITPRFIHDAHVGMITFLNLLRL